MTKRRIAQSNFCPYFPWERSQEHMFTEHSQMALSDYQHRWSVLHMQCSFWSVILRHSLIMYFKCRIAPYQMEQNVALPL